MTDLSEARERMVERQLIRREIADPAVLSAMRKVPREAFVPEAAREFAYDDAPLPIGQDQTISQPYIVALMIELAKLGPADRALEIGAGSGYAAAVMAEIAGSVLTIERHAELAEAARRRLTDLGYRNVEVLTGDGTSESLPAGPFDAIVAAAGGPHIPEAWKQRLAIGGRLVMPVGESRGFQRLIRLTRRSASDFEREEFGEVRFVPLIGSEGWSEEEPPAAPKPARRPSLPEQLRSAAEPLPDIDHPDFGAFFDRFGDRRVVLLGEASHGTSEFYRARAAISKRLIERHGFTIVAVEADWPDAAVIDRDVRHLPRAPNAEPPFRRFPTWMWRNTDVEAFVDWLRAHNADRPAEDRAGFHGLDLYNLSASISAVLNYMDEIDPEAARVARERYGCLTPWQKDPAVYGRAVLSGRYRECEDKVVAQLQDMLKNRLDYAQGDGETYFDAAQNARLIAAAERYYRVMYYGAAESWNLRDTHMFETLNQLLDARGPDSKAIVWAHNSHIGNAAATDMGKVQDEINIGQLCRERYGAAAALIGFGADRGTVAAASDWDGPMRVMNVRPSLPRSYERLCHETGLPSFLLDFAAMAPELRRLLQQPRLERFIGVIYRPETELRSHYMEARLPDQFDAYLWFDETRAVTPLATRSRDGAMETYPFGL